MQRHVHAPPRGVDLPDHLRTDGGQLAGDEMMQCAVPIDLDIDHLEILEPPAIGHLTTGFRIKSGAIENKTRLSLERRVSPNAGPKLEKERITVVEALGRESS
jgi:hypothetical protein